MKKYPLYLAIKGIASAYCFQAFNPYEETISGIDHLVYCFFMDTSQQAFVYSQF
jgi:hypothetical protein